MMWMEDAKNNITLDEYGDDNDSDDSESSTEEIPIWVRGEQRWVSGIVTKTTCQEIVTVLLQDEICKGKHIGDSNEYQITERWRGVEQPLDPLSAILDIWNAWGSAQKEVKISLRRIKNDKSNCRRTRCRSDSSIKSDKSVWKTIHPKRLYSMQNNDHRQPSNTEELLKLVLAQGEIIRRQLKKLRYSEHQIGCFEDKAHKARVRKHGSNYLLETYLKGLSEAADPETEEHAVHDKNSDSGVMTEGDSEQSNNNKPSKQTEALERFSPSSDELAHDLKDDDASSNVSEATLKEQIDLVKKIAKLNKQLLKQQEALVRLDINLKKYEKHKTDSDVITKNLVDVRTCLTKGACELQHNEVVLEETNDMLFHRKYVLENLYKDLMKEDQEHEMLQTLLYNNNMREFKQHTPSEIKHSQKSKHSTKELLDTLV